MGKPSKGMDNGTALMTNLPAFVNADERMQTTCKTDIQCSYSGPLQQKSSELLMVSYILVTADPGWIEYVLFR